MTPTLSSPSWTLKRERAARSAVSTCVAAVQKFSSQPAPAPCLPLPLPSHRNLGLLARRRRWCLRASHVRDLIVFINKIKTQSYLYKARPGRRRLGCAAAAPTPHRTWLRVKVRCSKRVVMAAEVKHCMVTEFWSRYTVWPLRPTETSHCNTLDNRPS